MRAWKLEKPVRGRPREYVPGILIVDDNRVLTMVLESLLSSMGHTIVGIAHSGNEAIALARERRPDMVLMDIAMPGELDGIDASEVLKRELDIPVVFLSTLTDSDSLDRAMKVDPLGYVQKPFSPGQIEVSIKMALHWCKRQKEQTELCEELALTSIAQPHNLRKADVLSMIQFVEIEELDTSLKLLMDHLGEDRARLEANVVCRLTGLFGSLLDGFEGNGQGIQKQAVIKAIESILIDVLRPFVHKLPSEYRALTLTEFRIVHLLKDGKRSKEIAEDLGLAPSTVVWHRKNIRKKLSITNTKKTILGSLQTTE